MSRLFPTISQDRLFSLAVGFPPERFSSHLQSTTFKRVRRIDAFPYSVPHLHYPATPTSRCAFRAKTGRRPSLSVVTATVFPSTGGSPIPPRSLGPPRSGNPILSSGRSFLRHWVTINFAGDPQKSWSPFRPLTRIPSSNFLTVSRLHFFYYAPSALRSLPFFFFFCDNPPFFPLFLVKESNLISLRILPSVPNQRYFFSFFPVAMFLVPCPNCRPRGSCRIRPPLLEATPLGRLFPLFVSSPLNRKNRLPPLPSRLFPGPAAFL